MVELGLDTFGDVTKGADGLPKPMDQVLRDVVDEAVLADQVGVDFIGLGGHHLPSGGQSLAPFAPAFSGAWRMSGPSRSKMACSSRFTSTSGAMTLACAARVTVKAPCFSSP